jgi:hypothetical protein
LHAALGVTKVKPASCALCDREFDGDLVLNSREHLIPNSIGGQKKVQWVLCKDCNDRTGKEWDAVLANQLSLVTMTVKVKRDRGTTPAIDARTKSGKAVRIHDDGEITLPRSAPIETAVDGGIRLTGRVSSLAEAEKLFKGFKRKYPKFDMEAAMERLRLEKTYLSEPIGGAVYIHGDASARSIVKSAFVLGVHSGVPAERCETARIFLKEPADSACWWFYYDGDLIPDRPRGCLFHCVAIKGNPATHQLIGYVEFFGAYRMVVLLSSQYDGKEIFNSYTVDPTTGEELSISPNLELPSEEVFAICRGERYRPEIMKDAIDQLMAIVYPKKLQRDREEVIEQAVRAAISKLGIPPDEGIGPEHVPELVRLVMAEITPFIISQNNAQLELQNFVLQDFLEKALQKTREIHRQ